MRTKINDKYSSPVARYVAKTYKRVTIKLRKDRDLEIINHLENVKNINQYIKDLILKDIENNK
mgnify:FL=1